MDNCGSPKLEYDTKRGCDDRDDSGQGKIFTELNYELKVKTI